jgi:cytidine deaminase
MSDLDAADPSAREAPDPAARQDSEALLSLARDAARVAYAPYSRFPVGAALRTADGQTFRGCNVESASYGLTICAERVAIFAALAAGAPRPFSSLAVSCPRADPSLGPESRMPCGACRQVMAEHLAPHASILVDGVGAFTLADLLPRPFRLPPSAS